MKTRLEMMKASLGKKAAAGKAPVAIKKAKRKAKAKAKPKPAGVAAAVSTLSKRNDGNTMVAQMESIRSTSDRLQEVLSALHGELVPELKELLNVLRDFTEQTVSERDGVSKDIQHHADALGLLDRWIALEELRPPGDGDELLTATRSFRGVNKEVLEVEADAGAEAEPGPLELDQGEFLRMQQPLEHKENGRELSGADDEPLLRAEDF